jgi:hypothetical protein
MQSIRNYIGIAQDDGIAINAFCIYKSILHYTLKNYRNRSQDIFMGVQNKK